MGIGVNNGWLSIVEDYNDEERLLVRARKLEHITNTFPDCDYFKDSDADYPYRAFIDRDTVAKAIAHSVGKIDYPNFKNSVQDGRLHNAYNEVWHTMYYTFLNDR